MPTLDKIIEKRENKGFKKREYRPWDIEGNKNSVETGTNTPLPSLNEISNINVSDSIIEIDPEAIKNWEFHDRPENELGDIESLAKDFKEIGQQQPCIVRPLKGNNKYQYELIAGERRWKAATLSGIKLKIIIKDLSDAQAAIIQASENSSREGLSDFAKGMSYSKLINSAILTQKDLSEKLNLSKQQISRLLSFEKIPISIIEAIGDMSKVSSRTAEQIKQLCSKGENYIDAILPLAEKLRTGKLGQEKLKSLVEKKIFNNEEFSFTEKVYGQNNRHLFTWRNDNNSLPGIHFPKEIATAIKEDKNKYDTVTKMIKEIIEDNLL